MNLNPDPSMLLWVSNPITKRLLEHLNLQYQDKLATAVTANSNLEIKEVHLRTLLAEAKSLHSVIKTIESGDFI